MGGDLGAGRYGPTGRGRVMSDGSRIGASSLSGRWMLDERDGVISDPSLTWQSVKPESRQDCEDLIALLERVKERLPDGK